MSEEFVRHGTSELFQAPALLGGYIRLQEVWFFPLKIKNLDGGREEKHPTDTQKQRANEYDKNKSSVPENKICG